MMARHTAPYTAHWRKKATSAPISPRISPSTMKGPRTKPSVAPHIFMMAISSRRVKVARRMVLAMMNRDTAARMATSTQARAVTALRTATKPSASSPSARWPSTPGRASTASTVSMNRSRSSTWMDRRSRNTSSGMLAYSPSPSCPSR